MLASMVMGALIEFPRAAALGAEVAVKDHEVRDAEQSHRPPDVDSDRGDELGRNSHGAPTAQALPTRAMRVAAITGPAMAEMLLVADSNPFALCRSAIGTASCTSPVDAGRKNALAAPLPACSRTIAHSAGACCVRNNANAPWVHNRTRSLVTTRLLRGNRSAHEPPSNTKTTSGTVRPASTNPSGVAKCVVASTANETAIGAIWSPRVLTDCARRSAETAARAEE